VDELAGYWDIWEDDESRVVCARLDWPRGQADDRDGGAEAEHGLG
jgi:hypothetical protein